MGDKAKHKLYTAAELKSASGGEGLHTRSLADNTRRNNAKAKKLVSKAAKRK